MHRPTMSAVVVPRPPWCPTPGAEAYNNPPTCYQWVFIVKIRKHNTYYYYYLLRLICCVNGRRWKRWLNLATPLPRCCLHGCCWWGGTRVLVGSKRGGGREKVSMVVVSTGSLVGGELSFLAICSIYSIFYDCNLLIYRWNWIIQSFTKKTIGNCLFFMILSILAPIVALFTVFYLFLPSDTLLSFYYCQLLYRQAKRGFARSMMVCTNFYWYIMNFGGD